MNDFNDLVLKKLPKPTPSDAISLVNTIVTGVSLKNPQETLKVLKEREALWKKKNLFIRMNKH